MRLAVEADKSQEIFQWIRLKNQGLVVATKDKPQLTDAFLLVSQVISIHPKEQDNIVAGLPDLLG